MSKLGVASINCWPPHVSLLDVLVHCTDSRRDVKAGDYHHLHLRRRSKQRDCWSGPSLPILTKTSYNFLQEEHLSECHWLVLRLHNIYAHFSQWHSACYQSSPRNHSCLLMDCENAMFSNAEALSVVEKRQLISKRRSTSLVMKRGDLCWIRQESHHQLSWGSWGIGH